MPKWKINICVLAVCMLFPVAAKAQMQAGDTQLLEVSLEKSHFHKRDVKKIKRSGFNPLAMPMVGAMWFYQKVISAQLSAGCLYHPSCSNYSKQCIEMYGWLKGIALSADRLSRCSRLSAAEILPTAEKLDGRVLDLPSSYKNDADK